MIRIPEDRFMFSIPGAAVVEFFDVHDPTDWRREEDVFLVEIPPALRPTFDRVMGDEGNRHERRKAAAQRRRR